MLLTPTSKATTPTLSAPVVAIIVSRPSTSLTNHPLMVLSYLAARWAILVWPLVLGLLDPMVLWSSLPFVSLLVKKSSPFIMSSLHNNSMPCIS